MQVIDGCAVPLRVPETDPQTPRLDMTGMFEPLQEGSKLGQSLWAHIREPFGVIVQDNQEVE